MSTSSHLKKTRTARLRFGRIKAAVVLSGLLAVTCGAAEVSLPARQAQIKGAIKKTRDMVDCWRKGGSATWTVQLAAPIQNQSLLVEYSATAARTVELTLPGAAPRSVTFPQTGTWNDFSTAALTKITLPAGEHQLTLGYKGDGYAVNIRRLQLGGAVSVPAREPAASASARKPKVGAKKRAPKAAEYPAVYAREDSWAASMTAMRAAFGSPKVQAALVRNGKKLDAYLNQKDGRALWADFPKESDWFLQDNQVHDRWGKGTYDARKDYQNYLDPARDNQLEQKLIAHVLKELKSTEIQAQFDALVAQNSSPDNPAWLELYTKACRLRRQQRLAPLLKETKQVIYAKHHNMGKIYLETETQGCPDGSQLRVIDLSPEAEGNPLKDEVLFDSNNGIVRDPELSFDGKRLLFAWRKTNEDLKTIGTMAPPTGNYKIYEMQLTDRSMRQLTTDETYGADTEPCYLPNGDIIFSSVRCVQEVTCGWGDASNLYLMNKDGKYARRIGFDQTQTAFPHLLSDGRVIFTRRDYNDRGQSFAHALFVMNPDGTMQTEYYGNNSMAPTSIQHTRQIPGSTKTMGIAGGYHTTQGGKLVTIDPSKGTQNYDGLEFYNWVPTPLEKISNENYCRTGEQYSYPYPFSEKSLLVSFSPIGTYLTSSSGNHSTKKEHGLMQYYLYYMTLDGRRELLAADPVLSCMQAIPVRPRKSPAARASVVDYTQAEGVCYVQDVYYGPSAEGIKRGSIKKLRVVKLFYKPITIGSGDWKPARKDVGPGRKYSGYGIDSVLPTGVGSASFDAKEILGEVEVHPDGSAMFEVPAREPVYFQLVDENGLVVQTMRSWATLMPNERFSCVGCHEENNSAPLSQSSKTMAMQRPPQKLQPVAGLTGAPFSYAKRVQPILNKHCVSCHAPGKKAAKYDLTDTLIEDGRNHGGTGMTRRQFYQSYLTFLQVGRRTDRQATNALDAGRPNEWVNYYTRLATVELTPPYYAGSTRSGVIKKLLDGHGETKISPTEIGVIAAWIDLNVPFIGEYDEMNVWDAGTLAKYDEKLGMRHRQEQIEAENIQAYIEAGQP